MLRRDRLFDVTGEGQRGVIAKTLLLHGLELIHLFV